MAIKFTNNAATTLSASISSGVTSFSVASASGFPTLGGSDWTYVTIDSEVVKVTAISGTTFTCVATGSSHTSGDTVELRVSAELLNDFAEDTEALPLAGGQMSGNITMAGSQTVDGRDLSADGTKLDGIASSANNYTHPNHSGEVTSSADGAQTITDNVVDEANLKVSNSPTNGYFLSAQSGNTGGLTWAEVDALPSQSGNSGEFLTTNGSAASWAEIATGNTTTSPMWEMAHTVSSNYTMTTNYNGVSVAPVTINTGVSVTVPSGSTWTIV